MGILNDIYKNRLNKEFINVGDTIKYTIRYDGRENIQKHKIIGIYSTSKYLMKELEYSVSPPPSEFKRVKLEDVENAERWMNCKYIFITDYIVLENNQHYVCPFTTHFFVEKVDGNS